MSKQPETSVYQYHQCFSVSDQCFLVSDQCFQYQISVSSIRLVFSSTILVFSSTILVFSSTILVFLEVFCITKTTLILVFFSFSISVFYFFLFEVDPWLYRPLHVLFAQVPIVSMYYLYYGVGLKLCLLIGVFSCVGIISLQNHAYINRENQW